MKVIGLEPGPSPPELVANAHRPDATPAESLRTAAVFASGCANDFTYAAVDQRSSGEMVGFAGIGLPGMPRTIRIAMSSTESPPLYTPVVKSLAWIGLSSLS